VVPRGILEIRSRANPGFKALRRLQPGFGSESILVEGDKLIAEALAAGLVPTALWTVTEPARPWPCPVYIVPERMYAQVSPTRSGRPPLAVFETPGLDREPLGEGRFLLLDRIQDPGNAGALVRAAVAFAFDGVLWHQPSVFPFHHGVIRASAGAVFRARNLLWSVDRGGPSLIGAALEDAVALEDHRWPASFVLVMGNEGHGFSAEVADRLTTRIRIPIAETVESLNVAGAAHILMYAARKGMRCGADEEPHR